MSANGERVLVSGWSVEERGARLLELFVAEPLP
jgi:hypothetical protein